MRMLTKHQSNIQAPQIIAILALTAVIIVVVVLLFANKPQTPVSQSNTAPMQVYSLTVQNNTQPFHFHARGMVQAATQLTLIAQTSGAIDFVAEQFAVGKRFKKGDLLLRINPRFAELELEKAQVQLAQAKLNAIELEANLKARKTHAAQSELAQGKPQLALAHAHVNAAQAAVNLAKQQLQQSQVFAPFDGQVLSSQVQPHQQVLAGTPLGQIFADDHLQVRFAFSPEQLNFIQLPDEQHQGAKILLHLPHTQQTIEGRIIGSEAHIASNRLLYLIAEFKQNTENPLLLGQLADLTIISKAINAITIPPSALRSNNTVWLLDEQQRLRIQAVTVLLRNQDNVLIETGLKQGDKLITSHLAHIIEEMPLHDLGTAPRKDL
jgi:membrane fusion protein, multidrug efflux system